MAPRTDFEFDPSEYVNVSISTLIRLYRARLPLFIVEI